MSTENQSERRVEMSAIVSLLVEQTNALASLRESIAQTNTALAEHTQAESERLAQIAGGFPGGDADAHRRYHEALIRKAEERADFWRKLRLELAKWGLIGFLGWLLVTGWKAFLKGPM